MLSGSLYFKIKAYFVVLHRPAAHGGRQSLRAFAYVLWYVLCFFWPEY